MTAAGWIFFAASWMLIIVLNVFCFSRIFGGGKKTPEAGKENK